MPIKRYPPTPYADQYSYQKPFTPYDPGGIGATIVIDWSIGDIWNYQQRATGVTLQINNLRLGTLLFRVMHDAADQTITFPVSRFLAIPGLIAHVHTLPAGASKLTLFTILNDGIELVISRVECF